MGLLPVALNVEGKRCLVVGGGAVALRKALSVLDCGAFVTVIAPALTDGFGPIAGNIQHLPRVFQDGDCGGYQLVFACTPERAVNAAVANEARASGIWCNVADDAAVSDFHSAARLQRGGICIGITTGGGSPALAHHLQDVIESCVGAEYEALLEMVSAQRAAVRGNMGLQADRAALWQVILDSDALRLLREGRRTEAEALVQRLVGAAPGH